MANKIGSNYKGYGENVITLKADDSLTQAGVLVKMSANNTVKECANGDSFIGVVLFVRDGYAAVQTSGVVSVKLSGSAACGYTKLVAGTTGTVKTSTTASKEYIVLEIEDNEITFIL